MRTAFIQTLVALAEKDPRLLLLTGDLGFMALEPFINRFPDRYFNVGVAEQNMIGLATGLAEAGFIPFVYSIVTFATLRPYEFIRNGPILHQLPVRIVGMGGGFEYGHAGITHHGLEDIGVMRVQPGISIVAPADSQQTETAIQATWDLPGPIYYRLGKNDKMVLPGLNGRFDFGRNQVIREGQHLVFVTTGSIAIEVVQAAEVLAEQGIESTVILVSTLNPTPTADLAACLAQFSLAVTVEAHYINGGLGSLVAEVIAENSLKCRLLRCGVRQDNHKTGSQNFLHTLHGLSSQQLVSNVINTLTANYEST